MAEHRTKGFIKQRPALSAAVRAKLVETLFTHPSSLIVGSIASVSVIIFSWCYSHNLWFLFMSAACACLGAARFWLNIRYRKNKVTDPLAWARWFALGGGLQALVLGVATCVSILQEDARIQMVLVTAQGGYVVGTSIRNNAIAFVSMVQIIPPFLLLFIGCLASRDEFYGIYSVFVAIHYLLILGIAQFLRAKTIDLLVAQEKAEIAVADLARANRLLEVMATTDGLTGVVNRRGFDTALARACEIAVLEKQPMSLLLLDIDHFKSLNDALGHQQGDVCLQQVAKCLSQTIRSSDILARYGGEEFAIILPDISAEAARKAAEQTRAAVEALGLFHPKTGTVTVSIGYCRSEPAAVEDGGAMVKRADQALYRAKSLGRNRVVEYLPPAALAA